MRQSAWRFVRAGLCVGWVFLLPACGGSASGPANAEAISGEDPPEVVAEVNGVPILRAHYEQMIEFMRNRTPQGRIERYLDAPFEALEALINDELLFQEATRVGTTVPGEQVEEEFARTVERAGGEAAFQAAMAAGGGSPDEIRSQLRRRLTIDRYIQETIFTALEVTEADALRYYNQNLESFTPELWIRVQRILVRCPRQAGEDEVASARARAEKILTLLRNGAAFDEMARQYSEDQTARIGGHLGLIKRGVASEEFDAVAFSIAPGEVSDVLRDDSGFHILRVLERRGGEPEPFEKVREECEKRALNRMREKAIRAVASKLRGMATVRTSMQ